MQRELTDALIRSLRPEPGKRLEVWDARVEGLVLRLSAAGRVTFHARARGPDGRKRFAGLGSWPATPLAKARTEALLAIGTMQKGADPTAERRSARAQRIRDDAMPSLRELADVWAKASARDTGARYRAEIVGTVKRGCAPVARGRKGEPAQPDLLGRRVDELTAADIAGAVQAARARGDGEARHLVRALRRLLNFAVALGHLEGSPVETWMRKEKGGRRSVPWMRDGIRERVLEDDELAKVWAAIGTLEPEARAFARLLLLSACRVGELAGLAWREIARDAGAGGRFAALTLPPARTKNRRTHRVPLGTLAAEALAELASQGGRGNDAGEAAGLVFPTIASRTAGMCRALRRESGVEGWTWHDLRRTAATTMARLGCPREAVEAALNHISARGGLVGVYQKYSFEAEAAQALLRWQAHVAGLVGAAAPVLPLRRIA